MATAAATATRRRASRAGDPALAAVAFAGAAGCVILTVALASGQLSGRGPAALAVAAFLLVGLWCLTHRRVDHTLVALALYLGLLDGYVKLRTGSSTVTLARDALVIAIAAGALLRGAQTRQRIFLPPLGGFVLAFSGVVLIELANPDARGVTGSLAGVRQHLEFVPLFFLGYAVIRTKAQLQMLLLLLVFCASLGGVVSLVQSGLTPDQLADWGPGYRERVIGTGVFLGAGRRASDAFGNGTVRPFGLGGDAGSGAVFGALALPALIALLMAAKGRARAAAILLSVGIALALATSGSRSALILALVSLMAFGITAAASKSSLRTIAGLSIATILIYVAFDQLSGTNAATQRSGAIISSSALSTYDDERGDSLAKFDEYVREYPFGAGMGRGGPAGGFGGGAAESSSPGPKLNYETGWNFYVLELGLMGLAVYLLLHFRLCSLAIRTIRRIPDDATRLYLAALAGPIFGLLAQNFSGPPSVSVPSGPYLWLVAGLLSYWLITRRALLQADAVTGRHDS